MGEFQHKESGYIATKEEVLQSIEEFYPIYLENFRPEIDNPIDRRPLGSPAMTCEEFAKYTWSLYDEIPD